MRLLTGVLVGLVLLLHGVSGVLAVEEKTSQSLALLPLEISNTGTYSYLNDSIEQMLITRLSRQEGLVVSALELPESELADARGKLQAGQYRSVTEKYQVDWVVDGRVSSLKDGIQVSLMLYPAAAEAAPASYEIKAEQPDQVMPEITALSGTIRDALFKKKSVEVAEGPKQPADDGLSGFQTPHPERDYKKGLYGGAALFGGENDDRFESKGVRKSSPLPIEVESMAFGDLDGDGKNELITASRSKIRMFRFEDQRFTLIASYDFSPNLKIHAINIGDPDHSGRPKLFVSANHGKYPASAVMSWDGSENLQALHENLRWYIRPLVWPGKGEILAGQRVSPNVSDNYLAPGVFQLDFDAASGDLKPGEKLALPPNTNLFDFIAADLNGDGLAEMMVIDQRQKLLVYDSAFNLVWVSSANYGGSKKFFGPPISQTDNRDPFQFTEVEQSVRKLVFVPGRLEVKDITGDGVPEVVVSTNEVGLDEYLDNFRNFDGGSVACLSWRGAGLMELWRTNHITGYVADYAFDGDGVIVPGAEQLYMNHLFVAQIPDASYLDRILPGSDKTRVLAYEMTVKKEPSPAVKN